MKGKTKSCRWNPHKKQWGEILSEGAEAQVQALKVFCSQIQNFLLKNTSKSVQVKSCRTHRAWRAKAHFSIGLWNNSISTAHNNKAIARKLMKYVSWKLTNFVQIGNHFAVRYFESDCEIRLQKTFHLNVIHLWQENLGLKFSPISFDSSFNFCWNFTSKIS